MEGFVRRGERLYCALEPLEAVLISRILIDTAERTILVTGIPVPETAPAVGADPDPLQGLDFTSAAPTPQIFDPAIALILPDGVPTDPQESAEFRQLTQHDLAVKKVRRLLHWGGVISHADDEFAVERSEVLEFVAALNDARLLLHSRREGTAELPEEERGEYQDLQLLDAMYHVLTWMAGAVLEASGALGSTAEDLDSIS